MLSCDAIHSYHQPLQLVRRGCLGEDVRLLLPGRAAVVAKWTQDLFRLEFGAPTKQRIGSVPVAAGIRTAAERYQHTLSLDQTTSAAAGNRINPTPAGNTIWLFRGRVLAGNGVPLWSACQPRITRSYQGAPASLLIRRTFGAVRQTRRSWKPVPAPRIINPDRHV